MSLNKRRRFLQLASAALLSPLLLRTGFASELSEDDPTAQALGYRIDASQVDDDLYKSGSSCANCMQYQGEDATGVCPLFPGKTVRAAGWCKAWVKKP
ncbi:MAG: high-potential iron-sulfur protein [Gammaproteobacteria bacterium]|nr:high-potential iron-sulfur protein [Gammaproteobacteria bacterium]